MWLSYCIVLTTGRRVGPSSFFLVAVFVFRRLLGLPNDCTGCMQRSERRGRRSIDVVENSAMRYVCSFPRVQLCVCDENGSATYINNHVTLLLAFPSNMTNGNTS